MSGPTPPQPPSSDHATGEPQDPSRGRTPSETSRGRAGHGRASRTVLITGGGGGLGQSVVKAFVESGASVHVPTFDPAEGDALADHLGDGIHAVTLHAGMDLSDASSVEELFRALPPVEVVVNLAGGFAMSPVHETEPGAWERMMRMNAGTAFLVSRAALPGMRTGGWGRILTVSAIPTLEGGAEGMGAYGASKAAVLHLTQVLAREGRSHGITANAVLPEIIDTPGNRAAMPDADRSRWLAPWDIAQVLLFLASEAGGIITGAAVPLRQGGRGLQDKAKG